MQDSNHRFIKRHNFLPMLLQIGTNRKVKGAAQCLCRRQGKFEISGSQKSYNKSSRGLFFLAR